MINHDHIYIGLLVFLAVMFYGISNLLLIKDRRTHLENVVSLEDNARKERVFKFRKNKVKISALRKIVLKAQQAGLNIGEVEIILGGFISALGAFFFLYTLFSTPYVGVIGIPLGLYLPIHILQIQVVKRGDKLAKQLHGCLQMWANSIRSGTSLAQAIVSSIGRVKPELNEELKLIKHNIDLGHSAVDALEIAQNRIPVAEFRMVVMTARIHKQLGGNLAERFENIALTIEDRVDTRKGLKAHTTQARMGAAVAGAMPFIVLAILRVLSPEYLKPMTESTTGTFLLMASVILVFIGWYIIRRIGDIRLN
ncbi:MAG: secretion system protein [Firmicutes bacterium]|nr:secretion system protein [Bacillota bacterium]